MSLGIAVALLALGPGTASAQPLTCGQTITRDTTLHADLGPCPGDGLVIGAGNVTLDLNGHSITGQGSGVGIKDDVGHIRTMIEDGVIQRFAHPIRLVTDHGRLTGITQPCCGDDGGVEIRGSYNVLTGNELGSTFEARVVGFRNRVTHNHFKTANGGLIVSGRGNLVAANSLRYGETGMQVSGAANTVRENIISFSGTDSALTVSGPASVIRGNILLGLPDAAALVVSDCRNDKVDGNFLRNMMRLVGCRNAAVVDNTLRRSSNEGILLDGGSGNALLRNTVSVTAGSGISVIGGSVETVVRNNLTTRAGRTPWQTVPESDGIHVEDSGTLIANNTANDNADYGIQAVPGVIDGGGNTASGNGNPLQCIGVVCN